MSSASNHAKRSHRSEYAKRSVLQQSARKAAYKQQGKTYRTGLFKAFANLFRRKAESK